MTIILISLSFENFLSKLNENPQLKFFNSYINLLNFSKWNVITNSKFMIEYNAMFENGFFSFGYEIMPYILYEVSLNKNETDKKIYEIAKQKNEFIFQAISTYIKALVIKKEIENKEKIISNYKKINEIIENEHKFKSEHSISDIILNKTEISLLENELKILKNNYENLLKTLNTYVEIDSVEEIDEVPQIEKINPQMTIDFKIIKKDKEIYHNNLILSYVQFLPSIKPSILRRNDGTYAFMIGFTFPIFPFNSIKQNRILSNNFNEKFLNYYENFISSKIFQIITDYENAKNEYDNYQNLKEEYEKILKTMKNEYKFSNFNLIEYYELENKLFEINVNLEKAKYDLILKYWELKSLSF
jgi:outer membrane protein TolC